MGTIFSLLRPYLSFASLGDAAGTSPDKGSSTWNGLAGVVAESQRGNFRNRAGRDRNAPIDLNKIIELSHHKQLSNLGQNCNFDVFSVAPVVDNLLLSSVGVRIMRDAGLLKRFSIPERTAAKFWARIESRYVANIPYHNDLHGADVMQTMFTFIEKGGLRGLGLTDLDILAALVAAGSHDVEHPGYTNGYLVKTKDPLAIRYNDVSPLENHHCATMFQTMLESDDANILANLSEKDWLEARGTMIAMILATDNAHHNVHLGEFNELVVKRGGPGNIKNLAEDLEARRTILKLGLHTSDLAAMTKDHTISLQWTDRVMEEFFHQGDRERELNLPISMLCDRETVKLPSSQVGFIDFLVLPLFQSYGRILTHGEDLSRAIKRERERWAEKVKEEERERERKKEK